MHRQSTLLLFALLLCAACIAQDRTATGYTYEELLTLCEKRAESGKRWEPRRFYNPHRTAQFLARCADLLVDGKFHGIPEESGEALLLREPKTVSVKFKVKEVFKGSSEQVIEIQLNDDMLRFPGEEISRNAKRWQVIDAQTDQLRPIQRELHALRKSLDAGEIDEQNFESEQRRLSALLAEKSRNHIDLKENTSASIPK